MDFLVMEHCAGVVDIPVSLFMVCHARRLACVKSIDSTVPVHRCLCFSISLQRRRLLLCPCLRWLVLLHGCEVGLHIHHPSRERRLWYTAWDVLFGCGQQHLAVRVVGIIWVVVARVW